MSKSTERTRGQGNARYDEAEGCWRGQIQVDGRRFSRRGSTRAEVLAKLDAVVAAAGAGLSVDGTTMTVAQLVEQYLEHRAGPLSRVSAATLATERYAAAHLIDGLGRHRAATLAPLVVERFLAERRRTLSASYVSRLRLLLSKSYRLAMRHQTLSEDRAALASTVAGATTPERLLEPLSGPEARALLDVARRHRLGVFVHLAVLAGLRPSELRGLQTSDVDLEAATLRITGQADVTGARTGTKTARSRRALHLCPELVAVLAEHLGALRAEQEAMGAGWPAGDLLLRSEAGTPVDGHNLRRLLRRWSTEAGLERVPTVYELRSTHATLSVVAGASLSEVAGALGHASTVTLQRHYLAREDVVGTGSLVASLL